MEARQSARSIQTINDRLAGDHPAFPLLLDFHPTFIQALARHQDGRQTAQEEASPRGRRWCCWSVLDFTLGLDSGWIVATGLFWLGEATSRLNHQGAFV